jgi:hypothetical protein
MFIVTKHFPARGDLDGSKIEILILAFFAFEAHPDFRQFFSN